MTDIAEQSKRIAKLRAEMSKAKKEMTYITDTLRFASSNEPIQEYEARLVAATARMSEVVRSVLGKIGDAVFLARNDEEAVWEAYVVVGDHTDQVYDAVVRAEDELTRLLGSIPIDVRVRVRQGQLAESVVPRHARRLDPR